MDSGDGIRHRDVESVERAAYRCKQGVGRIALRFLIALCRGKDGLLRHLRFAVSRHRLFQIAEVVLQVLYCFVQLRAVDSFCDGLDFD